MPNNDYWRFRDSLEHSGIVEADGEELYHGEKGTVWSDHAYKAKEWINGKWKYIYDNTQGAASSLNQRRRDMGLTKTNAMNHIQGYGRLAKANAGAAGNGLSSMARNPRATMNSAKTYAHGAGNTATAYAKLARNKVNSARDKALQGITRIKNRMSQGNYGASYDALDPRKTKKQKAAERHSANLRRKVKVSGAYGRAKRNIMSLINKARAKFGK